MANVVFIFNGEKTLMQSRKEEKMKNICEKFVSKIGADMRNLHFIYGRNQLNLDMTFNEQANSMDKNLKNQKKSYVQNAKKIVGLILLIIK